MSDPLPLFRPEVEAARPADAPPPHLAGATRPAYVALAAAAATGLVAFTVPISDIERAQGVVISDEVAQIRSPRMGTIDRLLVSQGQSVRSGAPLVLIRSSSAVLDGDPAQAIQRTLSTEAAALSSQLITDEARGAAEQASLSRQIESLSLQIATLDSQIVLQDRRVASARSGFDALAGLRDKGYVSEPEYRARENSWLAEQQAAAALAAERMRLVETRNARQSDIRLVQLQRSDRAGALHGELARVSRQSVEQSAGSEAVLTATRSGVLTAIQVHTGQMVTAGQLIALVAPPNAKRSIAAYVTSRSVKKLQPGMRVRLRFDALPVGNYTAGQGIVESVATLPVSPADAADEMPISAPMYRTSIRLTRLPSDVRHRFVAPPIGSRATVSVEVRRRSLADRSLSPAIEFMRERVGLW